MLLLKYSTSGAQCSPRPACPLTGVVPLRMYLETLGYTKEKRRLGDKEIWSKPDQVKGDIFYLYFNAAPAEVELTKVMNY